MRNPFKKQLTKWIPLGNYTFSDDDYIVMARKNVKTGMLYFKTINAHGSRCLTKSIFPIGLIDVNDAWQQLTKEQILKS